LTGTGSRLTRDDKSDTGLGASQQSNEPVMFSKLLLKFTYVLLSTTTNCIRIKFVVVGGSTYEICCG